LGIKIIRECTRSIAEGVEEIVEKDFTRLADNTTPAGKGELAEPKQMHGLMVESSVPRSREGRCATTPEDPLVPAAISS